MPEAWRRTSGARPLVLGHRGARHEAPENTLAAFEEALRQGADGVELDVRLSGQGDVVVFHDPDLTRLTDRQDRRVIGRMTRKELSSVRIQGEKVPFLEDVLEWAEHKDCRLNIELKSDSKSPLQLVRAVASQVRDQPHAEDRILLSSFNPVLVRSAAFLLPFVPSAWLIDGPRSRFHEAHGSRLIGASAIHPHVSVITAVRAARWKRKGRLINVWTVNDAKEALRLAALGVDGLITDTPAQIVQAVTSLSHTDSG